MQPLLLLACWAEQRAVGSVVGWYCSGPWSAAQGPRTDRSWCAVWPASCRAAGSDGERHRQVLAAVAHSARRFVPSNLFFELLLNFCWQTEFFPPRIERVTVGRPGRRVPRASAGGRIGFSSRWRRLWRGLARCGRWASPMRCSLVARVCPRSRYSRVAVCPARGARGVGDVGGSRSRAAPSSRYGFNGWVRPPQSRRSPRS